MTRQTLNGKYVSLGKGRARLTGKFIGGRKDATVKGSRYRKASS